MNNIRIISDIHGLSESYLKILDQCDHSIQLGDMGFNYHFLRSVDSDRHKFFGGNHDNYDVINGYPHNMGDYGEFELNGIKGFFIRGAFSIDWAYRLQHISLSSSKAYWPYEEQLSIAQLRHAVELYKKVKPDLVITHSCPVSVSRKFGSKKILANYGYDPETFTTNTQDALQECFEYHKPKLWHFGHFHFYKNKVWHGTRFVCQRELGWTDIDSNLDIVNCSELKSKHYIGKEQKWKV